MIKHLIFDFGNVLIDLHEQRWMQAMMDVIAVNDQNEVPTRIFDAMDRYERGKIATPVFINEFLRHADRTTQALDVVRAWNSILGEITGDRLTLLEKLKEKYSLYMLSNTNELHIDFVKAYIKEAHEEYPFFELFRKTYFSHDLKLSKPDSSIYTYILKDSNLIPEECLFFDDKEENLKAAELAGINTQWVDPDIDIAHYVSSLNLIR